MKKSNLLEAYNAHSYSVQVINNAIVEVVSAFGDEGLVFGEYSRPMGMDADRDEFVIIAVRYNKAEETLEAKTEEDGWFPIATDLGYDNFVDANELAAFILQQDIFED